MVFSVEFFPMKFFSRWNNLQLRFIQKFLVNTFRNHRKFSDFIINLSKKNPTRKIYHQINPIGKTEKFWPNEDQNFSRRIFSIVNFSFASLDILKRDFYGGICSLFDFSGNFFWCFFFLMWNFFSGVIFLQRFYPGE